MIRYDMLGNEIKIGDEVITYKTQLGRTRKAGLVKTIITDFTPKLIRTEFGLRRDVVKI